MALYKLREHRMSKNPLPQVVNIPWNITLINGNTKIRLSYNVQIPIKDTYERPRLHTPYGFPRYTVSTNPLHYPAMQKPFSPGSMNPLPTSSNDSTSIRKGQHRLHKRICCLITYEFCFHRWLTHFYPPQHQSTPRNVIESGS